ncbi:MAG: PHP domain-containing protein [Cetobacterium sp.]|uniref:PHP domain-containing protein n=1 Tax=Cetobacterium sp. TaxID=2071632 RepID=UPI003F3A0619
MIFLNKEDYSCNVNLGKKEIVIKVKKPESINEKLQEYVGELRKKFENFSFYLTIDDRYKLDNIDINNLYKLKDHVKQNIKIMVLVVNFEEKKTRTGEYMYTLSCEMPGKKKFVNCKIFSKNVMSIQKNAFYIVSGKVTEGNNQYIKKNERELGKNRDLSIMVSSLEKYEAIEVIEENKYTTPRQELHAHTMFSKNDGFITSKDIKIAFKENKVDQIALTDHGAVFAFIPFSNDLKGDFKDSNKRLLLGSEFYAVDTDEYDQKTYKSIDDLEEDILNIKEDLRLANETKEDAEEDLKKFRVVRDKAKKIVARKTATEEERLQATDDMNEAINWIASTTEEIKIAKERIKELELKVSNSQIRMDSLKTFVGKTHEIPRDHLTVIIKSKDSEMDYRGEKLKYNPGLVMLYKLITKSYLEYFSAPTTPSLKMYGKRPTIPYHELFKEGVREHFIINSACAFGKHMKLAVEGRWVEFKQWVSKLDAVEIQPMHNNIYMVNHADYPMIKSEDDVKKLHIDIYNACKEVGTKVIFTSDAHVNNKEDRDLRSVFKSGYITAIKSRVEEARQKKIAKGEEVEPEQSGGDDDFSVDTQPYILSYDDAVNDLSYQGFSQGQIKEIMDNTKAIADECTNAFEMTILPKKMFLGDFPGVNVKEEIPKLTWDAAIEKYSSDGTKEGIEKNIRERIETELDAIKTTGYEILYYISYWSCRKSEEMGYVVGSRGSAGSMMTTYLLGIGENNPLDPHYFCPKCKKVEWVETDVVGLDLPTKICECGEEMENDGCAIESHNFLGWGK